MRTSKDGTRQLSHPDQRINSLQDRTMKRFPFLQTIGLLSLTSFLAACAPATTQLAPQTVVSRADVATTSIAEATETNMATVTDTLTPEPTLAPTTTVTPIPTNTSTPIATKTPTATLTQTRVPSPVPTRTFTPSPRPEAPVFPQTHQRPFDVTDFRNELHEFVTFQSKFLAYHKSIVDSGRQGDCIYFYNYRNEMIVSQAAYSEVPDAWYSIYYQYRVLILEAVNNVQPISAACDAGGGDIPEETDLAIIAKLEEIVPRAQQLEAQAATIP
jgi:hypothetical protein